MTQEDRTASERADAEFLKGIAYAAAFVSKAHGETTIAGDLLNESGYRLRDFIEARIPEYELKELRRLARIEPRRFKR